MNEEYEVEPDYVREGDEVVLLDSEGEKVAEGAVTGKRYRGSDTLELKLEGEGAKYTYPEVSFRTNDFATVYFQEGYFEDEVDDAASAAKTLKNLVDSSLEEGTEDQQRLVAP